MERGVRQEDRARQHKVEPARSAVMGRLVVSRLLDRRLRLGLEVEAAVPGKILLLFLLVAAAVDRGLLEQQAA